MKWNLHLAVKWDDDGSLIFISRTKMTKNWYSFKANFKISLDVHRL